MYYLCIGLFVFLIQSVQAEISISNQQLIIGNDQVFNISQDVGQTVGNNLFHTFDTFNLNQGETALFSGNEQIRNIISRVVGGEPSFINGTIRSTIPNADFYFLNPFGIVFGEHAQLDLQGSFHASTADYLKLSDNGEFHARFPQRDILTAAPIESFGFLTAMPADLTIENSQLNILDNYKLSLTAGNIAISNAQIKLPSGHIYLATVAEASEIETRDFTPTLLQGNINISQQSLLDTSGDSGGGISIRSGQFVIHNSQLVAQTQGNLNADRIDIQANDIALRQGAVIDASLTGLGKGTDIHLQATQSITAYETSGESGFNQITAYADANVNQTEILQNNQTGDAGTISLHAKNIDFRDGSAIISETNSNGNGSNVTVTAAETIAFSGDDGGFNPSGVQSRARPSSTGKGGDILLSAEQVIIGDDSFLTATTYGANHAGDIMLKATGDIHIGNIFISNITFGAGNSGVISFEADNDLLFNANSTLTLSMGSGYANNILVRAKNINLDRGAYFESLSRRTAHAGDIIVEASGTISMKGVVEGYASSLNSNSSTTKETIIGGDAGNISIKAEHLIMRDGALISTNSFSRLGFNAGKGGNIDIDIRGTVDIAGVNPHGENEEGFASGIYANTLGIGDNGQQGGSIQLSAHSLRLTDGATIASSTDNDAVGGTIDIDVQDTIEISGDASNIVLKEPEFPQIRYLESYSLDNINQSTSGIYARSLDDNVASGAAGNINLTAQTLKISDKGSISTSSVGGGQAGHINLNVNQLLMDNTARIASESQFENRYQFSDIETRDNNLVQPGEIIEVADLGNGQSSYYINTGAYVIPARMPLDSVANLDELEQLSEQYRLFRGQIVEVEDAGNNQSARFIYTRHHSLELETWQRMDETVTTVLDTPQAIIAVRKDNNGYAEGELLPDFKFGERVRVLDMGDGKPAEFIYADMPADDGAVHVDFIQIGQFSASSMEELNALPEQISLEGEYPIATLEIPEQGATHFIYNNTQWIELSAQRQVAQILDIENLTLAKIGNTATVNGTEQIYTGQNWIDLHAQQQTVQTVADLAQLSPNQGELVKVMNAETNRPENYFYADGQWLMQAQGGDAGTIAINTNQLQLTHNATITTEAITSGGGGISLNVDEMLYLNNSYISTSVREGAGNGGNLTVSNAAFLVMHNAKLIAQAYEGQGGNIRITAEHFIQDPVSFVSASSQLGIDGDVEIDSPDETIGSGLLALNNDFAEQLEIRDMCREAIAGQLPTEFLLPLTFKVNIFRRQNDFIGDWTPSDALLARSCR